MEKIKELERERELERLKERERELKLEKERKRIQEEKEEKEKEEREKEKEERERKIREELEKKKLEEAPDLLALDAEGLDYNILASWDVEKYPFKIVIAEAMDTNDEPIRALMENRGYYEYARTPENAIWLRKDCNIFI